MAECRNECVEHQESTSIGDCHTLDGYDGTRGDGSRHTAIPHHGAPYSFLTGKHQWGLSRPIDVRIII